jgi:antibiotic biosynthesis monooxygenase (ABM) superfamily enzyme
MTDRPDASDAPPLTVTVVVSRHPATGKDKELTTWAHGISEAAAKFEGHLGAQIYAPAPPDREDLVIAFSFATAAHLSAWESSPERAEWLAKSRPLSTGALHTHAVSGFEGIFAASVNATAAPPPRWKTAIIIACALYPASLLLNWLVLPHLSTWSVALRVLLSTALIVPWMTWLGVPYLTRWLKPWLTSPRRT